MFTGEHQCPQMIQLTRISCECRAEDKLKRISELLPPKVPFLGDLPDPAHRIFAVRLLVFPG